MRSLLLAASFPPSLGGVETLLYQTNRRLDEPPLVLAPYPAAAPDLHIQRVQTSLGARLAYRPLWRLHPSLHYLQTFWRPALEAIRTWRPRVLQIGHVYLAPLGSLLARRFRLPYVVYAYGQEVWRGGQRTGIPLLDAQLRGRALGEARSILVPGTFTAKLLVDDWCVSAAQLAHVPYGADPRPVAEWPRGNSLLTVARLIPRKGVDTVLHALAEVPPTVTYRVVGRGPDEPRLRELVQELGLEQRVTFLGRLDDRALEEEYRRCAMFVLPARRTAAGDLEGYGLVYFEAAAWGRAVIAGRSGGEVDAVVDGETGLLVDGESVGQVRDAIAGLLGDRPRLRALGEAGRARVASTHNWDNAALVVDKVLSACAC